MEIRNWNWYIVINCAILPFLAAKTFSLNEALAAESEPKPSEISLPPSTERTARRFTLNKNFPTEIQRKNKFEKLLQEKLSPLKKYKSHQIKSPLKIKKSKHFLRPSGLLTSRRNYSNKRDTYKNEKKYFPILKNLGELLNNLLNSQSIDSYEITKTKQKRHNYEPEARRGIVCKCALQSDSETGESRSYKKTTAGPETVSAEDAPAAATAAVPASRNVSSIRQNKDVPLLLPRDPSSNRRNSNGHHEGSRPTLHGSSERNLPRHLRDSKHHPRFGNEDSHTQSNEKATFDSSRNYASGDENRSRQHRGGNRNVPIGRRADKRKFEEDYKTNRIFRGDSFEELSRENQFKVRRNQTKSENVLRKHVRRLRRPVSEVESGDVTESVQSEENYEESFNDVSFDNTSDKRIASRGGPPPAEAKETSATDENMISLKDLSNLKLALKKSSKMEEPSVTIIDGYSVARDKNGQNKLSEKTIHIHT